MKKIWYLFVKYYMRLGFTFYFKKIMISGVKNIPEKKAVLFVANHQNALIDPLLIGAMTPRELNFLTRADVFDKPFVRALLSTVNMLPIYRIRDGMTNLSKNEEVFDKCRNILYNKGTLLIFPEGNHNIRRRLRVLSKGFTRIIFSALEAHPDLDIDVIPVGINYTNAKKYGSSVHIIFGQPISIDHSFAIDASNGASTSLKDEVAREMKKLITHVEDLEHYDQLVQGFKEEAFLYPDKFNKMLSKMDPEQLAPPAKQEDQFNFLHPLFTANSIITILIWKWLLPKVAEEEFISTYRFSLGMTLLPLCYILQAGLIAHFLTDTAGILYLLISILIAYLYVKSR